jgi:hypothetical protein
MKKLVFASVMALAIVNLVSAPMLRAQDSTITIKDPAEFNTYQMASTQADPKAKAAALESFLTAYPQSVVKPAVLDSLIDLYQGLQDANQTLSAATRLLQVDPSNMKALFMSVLIKKSQCAKTSDAQTCDDAAALAQRGLTAKKPAATADADWKKLTSGTYPVFHSAIALDDVVSKKDIAGGIGEYRTELMLFSPEQTTAWPSPGLWDTLQLAEAYTKSDAPDHLVQAVWFYARAWNFATPIKPQIEAKMEYYYKKYHGNLDGLDAVKTQAAATLFPPGTFVISPAPTPVELAHKVVVETPDLTVLNLEDKEFILANGSKDDADKLWKVLKDQVTPVPGVVIEATSTVIKVAVTADAKNAQPPYADFIVNLKKPLEEKEIPALGFEYKIPPATTLVGTYDSYQQIPATATRAQTAEIVLRDGEISLEKKKPGVAHKPAAGHHTATH